MDIYDPAVGLIDVAKRIERDFVIFETNENQFDMQLKMNFNTENFAEASEHALLPDQMDTLDSRAE